MEVIFCYNNGGTAFYIAYAVGYFRFFRAENACGSYEAQKHVRHNNFLSTHFERQ